MKTGFEYSMLGPGGGPPTVLELIDGMLPNPKAWTQATWFVDPVSGDDALDGKTPSTAVKSYNGGIVARWGTLSPVLRQDTTITWLSSQPSGNADPVVCRPVLVGAVLFLTAVPARTHVGAIAGVTSKARATATLLQATLGASAPVGSLIKNVTPGKTSFAWVYLAGAASTLTQPLTPVSLPIGFPVVVDEVDTWANGDTVEIYQPLEVNLVALTPTIAEYVAPSYPAQLQVSFIRASSPNGVAGDNLFIGNDVTLYLCHVEPIVTDAATADDTFTYYMNCFLAGGAFNTVAGAILAQQLAGALISAVGCNVSFSLDLDVIVDAQAAPVIFRATTVNAEGPSTDAALPFIAVVCVFGRLDVQGSVQIHDSPFVGTLGPFVWGPGSLNVLGASRAVYPAAANAAVATFLQVGGLTLNEQTNANAFDPATGAFGPALSLTPPHLDAPFGPGGFGGLAVNVGGAAITNQATP